MPPIDNTIPQPAPGIASFATETFGGPAEPRYGEGVPTTVHRTVRAAADLELPLYSVVKIVDGVISFAEANAAAGFATGTVTFASTGPANGQTIEVGGVTYTYVTALSTGPTVPNQITVGGTTTEMAAKLAAAINGEAHAGVSEGTEANPQVSASASGAVTTISANAAGDEGNAVQFENVDAANATFAPSSDVLAGGADDVNDRPFGILAAPVVMANGDEMSLPFYRQGHWELKALVFGPSFVSDEQKINAFEGSLSPTIFVSKGKYAADGIDV